MSVPGVIPVILVIMTVREEPGGPPNHAWSFPQPSTPNSRPNKPIVRYRRVSRAVLIEALSRFRPECDDRRPLRRGAQVSIIHPDPERCSDQPRWVAAVRYGSPRSASQAENAGTILVALIAFPGQDPFGSSCGPPRFGPSPLLRRARRRPLERSAAARRARPARRRRGR
jgi:hypothetical protein